MYFLLVEVGFFIYQISSGTAGYTRNLDLGNKFLLSEDYDSAISAFSKAIEIDSMKADAYIGRGDAYKAKGDYEKAWDDYEKAQELSGNISILIDKIGQTDITVVSEEGEGVNGATIKLNGNKHSYEFITDSTGHIAEVIFPEEYDVEVTKANYESANTVFSAKKGGIRVEQIQLHGKSEVASDTEKMQSKNSNEQENIKHGIEDKATIDRMYINNYVSAFPGDDACIRWLFKERTGAEECYFFPFTAGDCIVQTSDSILYLVNSNYFCHDYSNGTLYDVWKLNVIDDINGDPDIVHLQGDPDYAGRYYNMYIVFEKKDNRIKRFITDTSTLGHSDGGFRVNDYKYNDKGLVDTITSYEKVYATSVDSIFDITFDYENISGVLTRGYGADDLLEELIYNGKYKSWTIRYYYDDNGTICKYEYYKNSSQSGTYLSHSFIITTDSMGRVTERRKSYANAYHEMVYRETDYYKYIGGSKAYINENW